MRLRDTSIRTGRLLAALCATETGRSRGLLFLIRGVEDVESLARIEAVLVAILWSQPEGAFSWFDVVDSRRIAEVHPALDTACIVPVELREFAELDAADVDHVLRGAVERAARFERALFPSAGAAVGSAAEGVQFIERRQELDELAALLEPERLVLLQAPRRTGKTSLLREFTTRRPADVSAVHVDLESAFTWAEAAATIAAALTGARLSDCLERASRRGADTVLRDALRAFRKRGPGRAALFIDELVYFLRTMTSDIALDDRPAAAQAAVRALVDACREAQVCLVIAGSIELTEYLTEELGIDENTLPSSVAEARVFALPPLLASNGHVRALLIGAGIVPEGGDADWLRRNIDLGMPLAALAFLDQLGAQVRSRGTLATRELDAALDDFLDRTAVFRDVMDRLQARSLAHAGFRSALTEVMRRLADNATGRLPLFDALERFSDVPGVRPEDSLRWVVENLPVIQSGNDLLLASRIFGRWWIRRHG
jgi:hypothetical protein